MREREREREDGGKQGKGRGRERDEKREIEGFSLSSFVNHWRRMMVDTNRTWWQTGELERNEHASNSMGQQIMSSNHECFLFVFIINSYLVTQVSITKVRMCNNPYVK